MNPGFILIISVFIQLIISELLKAFFPGFIYSDIYSYIQVPLSTFLSIFIPSWLCLNKEGKKYFTDFSKGVKPDILILTCVALGLCTQFTGIALNMPVNILLKFFKGSVASKIPASDSLVLLGISIICFALIPALCEEVLFRGIVLRYFRRYGNKASVIISALLFALMHLSFGNFIPPFFMGIIFGMMFVYTNRLIYPTIAHFMVNLTACVITFTTNFEILSNFYNDYFWIFIIVSIPSLYCFMKFFKANAEPMEYADMDLINNTKETVYNIDEHNAIKVYEHDIRENNIRLAFKDLFMSPYFYILIIVFVYLGGSSLW